MGRDCIRTHRLDEPESDRTFCGKPMSPNIPTTTGEDYDCPQCRKQTLSDSLIVQIADLRSRWLMPWESVAHELGINLHRLYHWRKVGKRHFENGERSMRSRLVEALWKADVEFEKRALEIIVVDGSGERGMRWMLERRMRAAYGKSVEQRHTNQKGLGPIEVTAVPWEAVKDLSPEQIAALAALVEGEE